MQLPESITGEVGPGKWGDSADVDIVDFNMVNLGYLPEKYVFGWLERILPLIYHDLKYLTKADPFLSPW